MTELTEPPLTKLEILIEDAIKKCQTHAYCAKSEAGVLRYSGFSGDVLSKLIEECETALKYAHLYQGYINAYNAEGNDETS